MGITADKIFANNLVDLVVEEPLGGAHRNVAEMMSNMASVLKSELRELKALSMDELITRRYKKFMAMGACD